MVALTGRDRMPMLRLQEQMFAWLKVAGPRVALTNTRGIHNRNTAYAIHEQAHYCAAAR